MHDFPVNIKKINKFLQVKIAYFKRGSEFQISIKII